MRKTRSQTQAANGPSVSTRSLARSAAVTSKTSSPASSTAVRDRENDKKESGVDSNPTPLSTTSSSSNQSSRQAPEIDSSKFREYEDMIQTFRVVDLHKVLQFLSQSIAGRKHELQQRVLDLLRTNFDLVSTKLREIYRTEFYSERGGQYGPPDPKRMFSHMQMPTVQSTADVRSAMVNVGNVGGGAGVGGAQTGNGGAAVPGTMGVPFQHAIASMPIHPDVRLKKLAFYDVLATLIKPSSLLPRTNQRIQELPFYFTLTPQQATEIATNRDIRNGSKVEHSIQVQLRFCLLETSCEQEDCFPSNVIVKVNNKLCPLPNPIPTNRPNVEPKRPPRPVNVTSNVKLSPTVTNTVIVQWCPDFSRGYCIAAYLVKKLTSSQLLHRMKTKGIKPADYTRGLIKEKLTEDADCEIATTMLKVSLNCPLGKMKMSIPCRASTCSHLQCFDANLYLQMNERKPTWNCPVCDKPAIYDNLVIDGYFQEVLASSLLGSEDTEIQLHKDGSWSTHNLRNEAQVLDTPSKPVEKVELISDDIELITDDVKPITKAPPPPVISNEPTSTTNSETVDLTLSDSDDDMPLAKRKTATAKNAANSALSAAVSTSNGLRLGTAQSSSQKGASQGSLTNKEQEKSSRPACPFSNTIRKYLKANPSANLTTTIQKDPMEKTQINNNQQKTKESSNKSEDSEGNSSSVEINDVCEPETSCSIPTGRNTVSNYKKTIKRLGKRDWESLTELERRRIHNAHLFFEREGLPKDGPHANSTQNPSSAKKNMLQEDVQCASNIEISKSIPRPRMEPNAPSSLGDGMTGPVIAGESHILPGSSALPNQRDLGGQNSNSSKLNTIPSFTPHFYTPRDLDNDGVILNQMPVMSSSPSICLNSPARSTQFAATSNTVTPSTPVHTQNVDIGPSNRPIPEKPNHSDSPFGTEGLLRNLTEGKENPPSVERNDFTSTSKPSFAVTAKTISNYKTTIKRLGTKRWDNLTELERKRLHTAHAYFEREQRTNGPNASSITDTCFPSLTTHPRPKKMKEYRKTIKKLGTMSWDELTEPERKSLHRAHLCFQWERVNQNKSDCNSMPKSSSVINTGVETNVGISNPAHRRFVEPSAPSSLGKAITDPPVSERYSLWESFLNNQGNADAAQKTTQQRIGVSSDSNTKTSFDDNLGKSKSDAASNQSMKKNACNKELTPNIPSKSPVRSAELPPKTPVQKQNIASKPFASSSRLQEFLSGTVVPFGFPTQCQTDSPFEVENLNRNLTEEKTPQNVDKNDIASPKYSYVVRGKTVSNYKRTIKRLGTKEWDSLTELERKRLHGARVFFEREGCKKNSPYAGLALHNYFRSSTTNLKTKTISNYRRTIKRLGKRSWDALSELERKDLHSSHLFFERERLTMEISETDSTPTPVGTTVEHAPTNTVSNSTPRPCLEPYAPSSLGEGMADLVIGKRYKQSGSFLPNQESSNAQQSSPSSNTSLIVPNFYTPRGPNGDGMPSNEIKDTTTRNIELFQGADVPFDPFEGIRLSEIQQRRHRYCIYRPWGEILVLLNRGGTKAMLRFKDKKKVIYIDKKKSNC